MINQNFVFLGALIGFLGALSYLKDTLSGKTKPNRVSWFLWALAPMLAFGAQISKGVGLESLITFMVGFSPLLIFLASFVNKKSEWKISKLDIFCGALSVAGIITWLILKEGNLAIFFAILADGLASIPTVVKSYKYPETENYWGYLTGIISTALTLLTIKTWDFANYGFALYILLDCALITVLIKFKLGKMLSLR